MCGIAGMIGMDGSPVSPVVLRNMAEAIAHRGPDGEGFYLDQNVGLAHRRLAIIDLSPAGHQPMIADDQSCVIVYNGEIYNYQNLRLELESLGYAFRTRTDTEVLLNAYREWGEKCVHRLNGMFAFAIWDLKRRELFLARDRYGIKPLYYAFMAGRFLFASEHKAILTHPEFKRSVDHEALLEYFVFQNIFTDKTLLKGIKIFPAGHFAKLASSDSSERLHMTQYWDFDFQAARDFADENEYVEELERLLVQAVNRQLVGDVEIGAYLSGGMDSGTITSIASSQISNLKSFTVGFDLNNASGIELGFDERTEAEFMSYTFKTEQYEMVLKSGDMERILPRLTWHLEEPRVGQCYPNFYVSQLAAKFVKVVLCGTGGDELFGGYPWRYYRATESSTFDNFIDSYYDSWQRLIKKQDIPEVFKPIWRQVNQIDARDIFANVFSGRHQQLARPEDCVNHSLYFEAKTFLHGLLVVGDKMSMAHGLETRIPFLDNDLVDFAMKVPVELKLKNLTATSGFNENEPGIKTDKYFRQTNDGKIILRKAMAKYIPEHVTRAGKKGFSAPDASWFKGESIEFVKRIIFDRKAILYNYFDRHAVHRLVNDHLSGRVNRRLLIWSLLNFEYWCRHYHCGD
jgi:asparagine synthase (glutamine-hydrolysing)